MKTELIEYHRHQARFNTLRASDFESGSPECLRCNARIVFHERAVEWLEQIPDTFSAAATFLNEVTK